MCLSCFWAFRARCLHALPALDWVFLTHSKGMHVWLIGKPKLTMSACSFLFIAASCQLIHYSNKQLFPCECPLPLKLATVVRYTERV